MTKLTQVLLHKMFVYEPDTGMLRRIGGRKDYPWRGIGKDRRYLGFTHGASGKTIYLHQAVWLYHHGWLPPMLDHRNNIHSDCRIENLRPCTNAQNQYNSPKKSNNRSGFKGVVGLPLGYRKPYRARIVVNKEPIHLGYFDNAEEAAVAYATAADYYAKEFARHA